jgi:hypothetical protein
MKKNLKKPLFISVPKGIDVEGLSEKDIDEIYKAGVEAKKAFSKKAYQKNEKK